MMSHRILPAALLLCTFAAACADLPTRNDTQAQPDGPAYDGGYGMGSGNSATSGPDAETLEPASGSDTSAGDDAGRGGYGMGSGN
jgi:hypothetical protein